MIVLKKKMKKMMMTIVGLMKMVLRMVKMMRMVEMILKMLMIMLMFGDVDGGCEFADDGKDEEDEDVEVADSERCAAEVDDDDFGTDEDGVVDSIKDVDVDECC